MRCRRADGASTGPLPGARLTAVDVSAASLDQARARVAAAGLPAPGGGGRVEWVRADLHDPPFADGAFDHVFVCFVLEHLPDPGAVLAGLRRVLRPGGTLTVIEGDHGSAFFHPDSAHARAAVSHLVALQAAAGGDALVGRRLRPLVTAAGYARVTAGPRTVYADEARPDLARAVTLTPSPRWSGRCATTRSPRGSARPPTSTAASPTCAARPPRAGRSTTRSSRRPR